VEKCIQNVNFAAIKHEQNMLLLIALLPNCSYQFW